MGLSTPDQTAIAQPCAAPTGAGGIPIDHHHCTLDPDVYRVPDVEVVAARYRERIPDADNESELLVAEIDGQVAATCLVRLVGEPGDASMFIPGRVAEVDVAVLAAFRGHGLGRALMHQAERWAAQRGHGG